MLNKDQKELLKWLIKHPAWQLVKDLETEALNELWRNLLSVDVNNEEQLKLIRDKQIYATARKEFIKSIESQTMDVFWNDISLI